MSSADQVETERKYHLAAGQQLPSLAEAVVEGPVSEFDLVATYYDTPDLRLLRAKQVIRRRLGGADEGWHLKRPGVGPDDRIEAHAPVNARRLPAELRQQVADSLDDAPVIPVAVLRTHRREQQLLDHQGAVVAVVCTDQVRAEVGESVQHWQEAEVELVGGDPGLLDAIEALLAGAGIHRAPSASKIGKALTDTIARARAIPELDEAVPELDEAVPELDEGSLGPGSTAGEAVLAYLTTQIGVLQNQEADVVVDAPDSVHRSRVATRRLRSALRTYGRVFAAKSVRELRDELRWHAEELGAPRDAEVLSERLREAVEELDAPGQDMVAGRIEAGLSATHAQAHRALVEAMSTPRYERLQLALERLLARPPLSDQAGMAAPEVLPVMLARTVERVRRLAAHAEARPTDLTRWHEVRKAAKAARYGAELLVPVLGEPAVRHAAQWQAVTEALGAVQDAVVCQQVIGELSWHAVSDGLPRKPFDDLRHDQDRLLRESLAAGRTALRTALDRRPS